MNMKINYAKFLQVLTATCCLSLIVVLQSSADTRLEQPRSVTNAKSFASLAEVERLHGVTPVSCTDSCCGGGACSGGNCCCEAVCCPKRVTEEVKQHCWKVEPELVCIPGFRFQCNWNSPKCGRSGCDTCCGDVCSSGHDNCCPPKCGRVRCIHVLEKHEYTCEKCGYEWEAKCVRASKACGCRDSCNCPACGTAGCCASVDGVTSGATDAVQLTAATVSKPQVEEKKPSLSKRLMQWLK